MVGFDRYDQLWVNVGSDNMLSVSRVGEGNTAQVAISLPIRLRIEKSGVQFSFLYKPDNGTPQPWTTLETRNVSNPVKYIGLRSALLMVTILLAFLGKLLPLWNGLSRDFDPGYNQG
jgi:hypothetical protein